MSDTKNRQNPDVGGSGLRVPSTQNSARAQSWRALGRALISGYVDSYTLLHFGVYASFMSGNTTSAGFHAGQAKLAAASHSALPIPFFVLGIFVGTLLVKADPHHELPRLSALVAAMLVVVTAVPFFAWPGWLSIMILSTAMGIMNTSITRVGGQSVSLGFVTGDLNGMAQHLAMGITQAPVAQAQGSWDTHWRRAALLAGVWATFLVGAVLGSALASRLAVWTLLLPALTLSVFALLDRATTSDD
jgi:uncharacterized membrane protein YoaK (UPF0700 family)